MKYIAANFVATIKDWAVFILDNKKASGVSIDKIDSFKYAPYLSDLVLYSIQSKIEGRESSIFPNLYEEDLIKLSNTSKNNMLSYFNIDSNYKSINFDGNKISDYINNHAYFHVAGTYLSSNFDNSTGLCIDYLGYNDFGNHQVQTIWNCDSNNIELVDDFDTSLTLDRGIGFAYSIFADFFGLYKYDLPYISMYGDASKYSNIEIYEYKNDNVYFRREFLDGIDINYNIDLGPKTFYASIEGLGNNLDIIYKNIKNIFSINENDLELSKQNLTKGIIPDIIAHLENKTKEAVLFLAEKAYKITKNDNLTVSGWLASNHLLCRALVKESRFKNFSFEISPNYAGISIGAAYYLYNIESNNKDRTFLIKTGYGNEYSNDFIEKELLSYKDYLSYYLLEDSEKQNTFIVDKLIEKKVIAYFKGGAEIGPRALGNRSIISVGDCEDLGDKIRKIKNRQNYKAFSCSLLEEDLCKYFDINILSPFMSLSGKINPEYKSFFSGINFDNNLIRYQTVSKDNNYHFYNLLQSYKEKTGLSFLLNTSLNAYKQAIVESPRKAIELFLSSEIDYLILGNYIVSKTKIYNEFLFDYEKLKLTKNIEYFNCNSLAFAKFNEIKKLFENVVFKDFNVSVLGPFYYDEFIIIDFLNFKLKIEQKKAEKKGFIYTDNLAVYIIGNIDKEMLRYIYKNIYLFDEKIYTLIKDKNYILKDLINYL